MIAGVGMDVVELGRLERIVASPHGRRFAERVLTVREMERWAALPPRRALEFLAGRFAAKEAAVKAIGCGIGPSVGFRDIEVLPDALGKPVCRLSEMAIDRLGWRGRDVTMHAAITHERSLAAATVVVEWHNSRMAPDSAD